MQITGNANIKKFKSWNWKIIKQLDFRISERKVVHLDSVKYLRLILQSELYWKTRLISSEKKLSRSIRLLSKIGHYVPKYLLTTIYYSIFNSHLIYAFEFWVPKQNNALVERSQKLQEKAVCLINFEINPWIVSQPFKGTVMQIEKALINDRLRVSIVSREFFVPTIYNFTKFTREICYFLKK